MTGLVRKAMLSGVCGLLAASAALANVPDPNTSTVPTWIFVVGYINAPSGPYTNGANGPPFSFFPGGSNNSNVIVITDAFNNPISNVGVHIKFPCDVNLCNPQPVGTVTCDADGNTLHGITDAAGRFVFTATGSSKDPGAVAPYFPIAPPFPTYPGGGILSTRVTVDGYAGTFKTTSAVTLDPDGIISSSDGTDGLDNSKQTHNVQTMLASPNNSSTSIYYRARADQDCSTFIDGLDRSFMQGHVLFCLGAGGGSRDCVTAGGVFCTKSPCP
jgi:hypothetical protein